MQRLVLSFVLLLISFEGAVSLGRSESAPPRVTPPPAPPMLALPALDRPSSLLIKKRMPPANLFLPNVTKASAIETDLMNEIKLRIAGRSAAFDAEANARAAGFPSKETAKILGPAKTQVSLAPVRLGPNGVPLAPPPPPPSLVTHRNSLARLTNKTKPMSTDHRTPSLPNLPQTSISRADLMHEIQTRIFGRSAALDADANQRAADYESKVLKSVKIIPPVPLGSKLGFNNGPRQPPQLQPVSLKKPIVIVETKPFAAIGTRPPAWPQRPASVSPMQHKPMTLMEEMKLAQEAIRRKKLSKLADEPNKKGVGGYHTAGDDVLKVVDSTGGQYYFRPRVERIY